MGSPGPLITEPNLTIRQKPVFIEVDAHPTPPLDTIGFRCICNITTMWA